MATEPPDPAAGSWLKDPTESRYTEIFMEHLFISDLQQHCAFVRNHKIEVLRAEVDDSGYDLVLEDNNGVIRHVQMKARHRHGNKRFQDVNRALERHAGGCVIWMFWQPDGGKADLTYRWWGGAPRQKKKSLPVKPGLKASQCRLDWRDFEPYSEQPGLPSFFGIDVIAKKLFGPA